MTPAEYAEWARGLREAATPGPWLLTERDGPWGANIVHIGDDRAICGEMPIHDADSRLIAAAPTLANAVIDLAAQVATLTAERDAARVRRGEIHEALGGRRDTDPFEPVIEHARRVAAERDRLARILAVERGDASAAGPGWRRLSTGTCWVRGTASASSYPQGWIVTIRGRQRGEPHTYAADAIDAADAALRGEP